MKSLFNHPYAKDIIGMVYALAPFLLTRARIMKTSLSISSFTGLMGLCFMSLPSITSAIPVSQGTITIPGTWSFDLDAGGVGDSSPPRDIRWRQQTSTTRQIEPVNGATIVNLGVVDFSSLTFSALQGLTYSTTPINGSNVGNLLVPGDVFAVRTNIGNYSKVLVTGPFDNTLNNGLPIQWVTVNEANQEVANVPDKTNTLCLLVLSLFGVHRFRKLRR